MSVREKIYLNPFILIWVIFGLLIYSYSYVDLFFNHPSTLNQFSFTNWLKLILPFYIMIAYCLAFISYKRNHRVEEN
ncbi:hypothetical protein [Roseivirga pacifica]|uniref:hypothetical protein n=1 Tax=Roseivirga pacifica TaxID=1267423 RepID=UPI0020941BD4|nr:hypothetical protein [Roseivirga pacifica]MCO6360947.1 hypothetical protein [Roseivirga pacifica]MCO6368836.1 hypothetical protein [Roseivirga pacifica]MCO6372980.1 hypothetical protein [Roseivirga pacifica]MCO6377040.1 hypothetical protein [Roseivirga pacifica]MCO6377683.1 hypothetical protein [Roseivirga pacifica]